LYDAGGKLLTGSPNLEVELFDAAKDGNSLCDTKASAVPLVNGRFSLTLDEKCSRVISDSPDVWAEVFVGGKSVGRTKLAAVPYAIEATHATAADAASGALAQQIVPAGAVIAFDLAACPAGWSELTAARGRTVIGVTSGLTRGTAVGANSLSLTVPQLPAHTHSGTTGGGNPMTHRVVSQAGSGSASNHTVGWSGTSYADFTDAKYAAAAHTHDFTTDATGEGKPIDNRQDSLPLLYCKKN
jgi:microcystin-dependent protein